MASFQQHVTFSSLLGIGYGAGVYLGLEFSPVQSALAGCLAAVGGMLPDLDAPNGKPGQEIFALTAAVAPLVLIGRVLQWSGLPSDPETIMLLLVGLYISIRYGLAFLIHKVSVHRGMFHSIPAMLIAGELVYLGYPHQQPLTKLMMAGAVTLGFFSHLLLDEIYSVEWKSALPSLKKSSGTAIKMFGPTFLPNVVTYAALGALSYGVLVDADLIETGATGTTVIAEATSLQSAPLESVPSQVDAAPTGVMPVAELGIMSAPIDTTPAMPPTPEEWQQRLRLSQPTELPTELRPFSAPPNTAELDAPMFVPSGQQPPVTDAPIFR